MKIVMVRHGHPNYKDDCLTDLGWLQAEAAAIRLQGEGIEKVYSSTCGRAMETAKAFAEKSGLDIIPLEFMREIKWGSLDGNPIFEGGHPWRIANCAVKSSFDFLKSDWREYSGFKNSKIFSSVDHVSDCTDDWLAEFGYIRQGRFYLCKEDSFQGTIALFSHGGSGTAFLSHITGLSFGYLCYALRPDFTAITVLELPYYPGDLVLPRFLISNDSRHIVGELGLKTNNM